MGNAVGYTTWREDYFKGCDFMLGAKKPFGAKIVEKNPAFFRRSPVRKAKISQRFQGHV